MTNTDINMSLEQVKRQVEKTKQQTIQLEKVIEVAQHKEKMGKKYQYIFERIFEAAPYFFVWEKEENGRYIFCFGNFAEFFYKLPMDKKTGLAPCMRGKTDIELITEFRGKHGQHTFGELCKGTDEIILQECKVGQTMRFIEVGLILGEKVILDVYKTHSLCEESQAHKVFGLAYNQSSFAKASARITAEGKHIELREQYQKDTAVYEVKKI